MEKSCSDKINVNGVDYVRKDALAAVGTDGDTRGLPCVLIRSYAAGVHFGYLESEKFTEAGKVVVLRNSRRAWYWKGAASLSQMAVEGVKNPGDCKFSMAVDSNEIVNVIETIPLTSKAVLNLYGVAIWKQ
jgi:hypothetical protein